MPLELDVSDYDPSRGVFEDVKPGRAHVVVTDWEEYAVRGEWHRMQLEVVAHDDPGEVGKIHSELFHAGQRSQWRLRIAALALKLTTTEALLKAREESGIAVIRFEDAIGRSMFVRFVKEKDKNGEERIRINQHLYALDDPKCAGWPKNDTIAQRDASLSPPLTDGGSAGEPDDPFGL